MTEILLQRRKTQTQTNKLTGTQLKMHVSKLRMYLDTMHRAVLSTPKDYENYIHISKEYRGGIKNISDVRKLEAILW